MRRYLLLGTISLLLFGSCKKQNLEPEPVLMGRWNWVKSVSTHYNGSGSVWYKDTLSPASQGAKYIVITGDSMLQYSPGSIARVGRQAYQRSGTILTLKSGTGVTASTYRLTILDLSEHSMAVQYEEAYLRVDTQYSR